MFEFSEAVKDFLGGGRGGGNVCLGNRPSGSSILIQHLLPLRSSSDVLLSLNLRTMLILKSSRKSLRFGHVLVKSEVQKAVPRSHALLHIWCRSLPICLSAGDIVVWQVVFFQQQNPSTSASQY